MPVVFKPLHILTVSAIGAASLVAPQSASAMGDVVTMPSLEFPADGMFETAEGKKCMLWWCGASGEAANTVTRSSTALIQTPQSDE